MWLCALAYWQLLLMHDAVQEDYPAWYPQSRQQRAKLTPYQVQRSALAFCWSWVHQPLSPDSLEKAKAGKRIIVRQHAFVIQWCSRAKRPSFRLLQIRNWYLLFSF
jgi:predicted lipid carrier protein YhbT